MVSSELFLMSILSSLYVINSSKFVCLLDKLQMANEKHNLKLLRIYGRAHERKDFPGMNQMSHC